MLRMTSLSCAFIVMGLFAGCGARTSLIGGEGGEGGGGVTSASHQVSSSTSGVTTGGGTCNLPPPPMQANPTAPGCYRNDSGMGWVEVPCECALWLRNITEAKVATTLDLTVIPQDAMPTLDGSLDVEITLDDPGGVYFGIWAHEMGNGTAFAVTNDGKATTVRMGSPHVTLLPIPVPSCTTGLVNARITGGGAVQPNLDMHAHLDEAAPFDETDNPCSNPPPTPPPM